MKTTIEAQIDYIRYDIKGLENGLSISDDPKAIAEYERELEMCRDIEHQLITIKEKSQPQNICTKCGAKSDQLVHSWVEDGTQRIAPGERLCHHCTMNRGLETLPKGGNAGTYEFKNPVQRGAGDDYPLLSTCTDEFAEPHMETAKVTWPNIGDSVMVLLDHNGTTEWVDAYVVGGIDEVNKENDWAGAPGVVVKTYWGALVQITDINAIQFSKKEVSNG